MSAIDISNAVRLFLVLGSVFTFIFIYRYIRKSRVRIEDTFFWLGLCLVLAILSIFPDIALHASVALGILSPINFVFLLIIFILIVKQFFMSMKLSQLEIKTAELAQQIAIDKKDLTDIAQNKKSNS